MNPIIILEGQDRCGKSTLVNQLSLHFGPGVIKTHSSAPPKDLIYPQNLIWEKINYVSLLNAFNKISETNTIVADRFHLGCPVFGKRYRNYSEDVHVDVLERNMNFNDSTYLILLTDDSEELIKRDDGKSFEKCPYDFEETAYEFKKEFNYSKIKNKLHVNISQIGGFTNILPIVLEFLKD